MKCKIKLWILAFLFGATPFAHAQKAVERADKAFELSQYNYAVTLYQKAFTKVKKNNTIEKNRINYQIAESYRLSGQYKKAVSVYKRVIKARYYEIEPKVYLRLGEIHRFNGDYEDAIEQFEEYLNLVPGDPDALLAIESCKKAEEWMKNQTRYEVANIRKINSKENDYAPRFLDKTGEALVFTSAREGATGKKLDDWTGQRFTDLFISWIDKKGDWGTPVLLEKNSIINTASNESDAYFINNGNTVYFTLCANERKKQSGCLIFTSDYDGENWSDPSLVPLSRDSAADCIHPWVSDDAKMIFFTSNMEGGLGDLDIWYATRNSTNEPFGDAQNVGAPINTAGKEGWPFLRSDTLLYFASNAHVGLGGLDIYKSTKENGQWQEPENMQVPVNSSADDFAITFAEGEERGFFTSNRKEGRGGDDTWSFVLPSVNFTISGVVRNNDNMQLMPQVLVQIVGSDGLNVQAFTNNRGFYRFDETQIKKDVTYKIWVSKSGFLEAEAKETTVGLNNGKDIVRDFRMEELPKGAVVLPDILYDVAKWDLKEQYQDSLIGLIELLERNPRLVVELASHTDIRPIAMTNDSLSQYRAQEVVNYLIARGIHPGRLVAKGYGAHVPRIYTEETQLHNGKELITIPAGTILTEQFIKTLPPKDQEFAHQLNRRTEFSILRDDFIPPAEGTSETTLESLVQMGSVEADNQIRFRMNPNGMPEIPVVVNGTSFTFVYDEKGKVNQIGIEDAMRLLKTGKINKNDFKNKEKAFDEEGDIILKSEIKLRELRIGKLTIRDINVIVTEEMPAPLLLNADALKQLGQFEIDRQNRVLYLNVQKQ